MPVRVTAREAPATIRLPGGLLDYTLRVSPRARRLRVLVDPRRGVVVTVPAAGRTTTRPSPAVERFLVEREAWLRRHLGRQAMARAGAVSGDGLADGSVIRFRGEPHRVRIVTAPASHRRSGVSRVGSDDGDELVIAVAARDRREPSVVLGAWFRERARHSIEREIAGQAPALGVSPAAIAIRDPRTRWGSASRAGRLSFSWRLVLAPPEALETVVVHELAHLRVFGHGPDFWAVVASRRPDHRDWRRWLRLHSVELHATLAVDDDATR